MNGKDRILGTLFDIQQEEPQAIMSIKSIAYKSEVGINHATRIVESLILDQQVQKVQKNYRIYYRMIPPTD